LPHPTISPTRPFPPLAVPLPNRDRYSALECRPDLSGRPCASFSRLSPDTLHSRCRHKSAELVGFTGPSWRDIPRRNAAPPSRRPPQVGGPTRDIAADSQRPPAPANHARIVDVGCFRSALFSPAWGGRLPSSGQSFAPVGRSASSRPPAADLGMSGR